MKRTLSIVLVAVALLAGRVAKAQDAPRVGVTMGYPSAVGVVWNVASRLALRPEVTLSGQSSDSSIGNILGTGTGSNEDGVNVGVGLSGLIYVGRWEALRTYVSPRFTYTHTRTTSTAIGASSSSEATGRSYLTSGSFGAEYGFARHFGVFGEVGLGYTAATNSLSSTLAVTVSSNPSSPVISVVNTRSDTHARTWGPRSGVGVIFFF
jgi:hypothetical protein